MDSPLLEREVGDFAIRAVELRKSDHPLERRVISRNNLHASQERAAMPFISKIEARAYARATEILERVETAVSTIFPEELRSSISMTTTSVEGQSGDTISIVSGVLGTKELCERVFEFILGEIKTEGRRTLERSIDLRLDKNCVFFMRFDKQAAFLGDLKIDNEVDIISVRVFFRDYPRCKREDTVQMIERYLQDAGDRENED